MVPYCFQIYQTDVCSLPLQTSKTQASKAARSISIDLGPLNAMIRVLQEHVRLCCMQSPLDH